MVAGTSGTAVFTSGSGASKYVKRIIDLDMNNACGHSMIESNKSGCRHIVFKGG